MDILDIGKMRSTVRSYSERPLEQDKLDKILEAGRWAPTAVNYQPHRILVLNSEETLMKAKEFTDFGKPLNHSTHEKELLLSGNMNGKSAYHYNASTALLVCYDEEACWKHPENGESSGIVDAAIVTTHMMLEAAAIGVGSSWISYFNMEKAKNLLGLPENFKPVVLLLLGYPAEDARPDHEFTGKRMPVEKTVFYNSFQRIGVNDEGL
jgi:nitroreductase